MSTQHDQKVATTSADIQNENLQKLRKVFPQFVKDGVVDFDALKAFFNSEGILPENDEKYGLGWAGKSNAFKHIRTQATGTLAPDKESSKNWDETENLFIEGDNLEVLKLLQKQYREKIKMIYIDPPYNTGKDFVYKDNFRENVSDYYERTGQSEGGIKMTSNLESNGRYHSDWLTMMYPRLFLARNLLKEDGVIFVSIDDNEVHNLRLVMDEIFGEENFLKMISRVTGTPTGGGFEAFVNKVDFILVYQKSSLFQVSGIPLTKEEESIYNKEDEQGKYLIRSLRRTGGEDRREDRPSMFYPIKSLDGSLVYPMGPTGYESRWICSEKKYKELQKLGLIEWVKNDGNYQPFQKFYLEGRVKQPSNLWDSIEGNKKATREVKGLFNSDKVFDFPKPVALIKQIIQVSSVTNDEIILDFFAGSGTTAHAVMAQNAEDDGNRKWICVQLPEVVDEDSEAKKAGYNTISEIARERIRRAGEQIGKGDIGFKSYKLSASNYRQWRTITDEDDEESLKAQMKLFVEKPLADDYTEEGIVYEILLKEGFDLNSKVSQEKTGDLDVWRVVDGERRIVVSFAKKLSVEVVESLSLGEHDIFVCLDSALDDTTKVNIMRNLEVRVM